MSGGSPRRPGLAADQGGRGERVLVVSGDGRQAGLLVEQLVQAGYTAMLTTRVTEAVRLTRDHQPVLVLVLQVGNAMSDLQWQLDADERTRHIPVVVGRAVWRTGQAGPDAPREARPPGNPRLVIVANRGPNDFVWTEQQWRTRP